MEMKEIYIVTWFDPKSDYSDFSVYADKENAEKCFNEKKKYIKENYNNEMGGVEYDWFIRKSDSRYNGISAYASLEMVNTTIEGERIAYLKNK